MPPSGPVPSSSSAPKAQPHSQIPPINQLSAMSPHQTSAGVFSSPQPTQFSQLPVAAPQVPMKKEIVFPPDVIESIQPVVSRRRKLGKVKTLVCQ